jgi:hypothetical protein
MSDVDCCMLTVTNVGTLLKFEIILDKFNGGTRAWLCSLIYGTITIQYILIIIYFKHLLRFGSYGHFQGGMNYTYW